MNDAASMNEESYSYKSYFHQSAVYFRQFESINHHDHDFETANFRMRRSKRRAVKLHLTLFYRNIYRVYKIKFHFNRKSNGYSKTDFERP